jgi:hypothetical protein
VGRSPSPTCARQEGVTPGAFHAQSKGVVEAAPGRLAAHAVRRLSRTGKGMSAALYSRHVT